MISASSSSRDSDSDHGEGLTAASLGPGDEYGNVELVLLGVREHSGGGESEASWPSASPHRSDCGLVANTTRPRFSPFAKPSRTGTAAMFPLLLLLQVLRLLPQGH